MPATPQADVTLVFDGGSRGNPGQGYGSFVYSGVVSSAEPITQEYPGRTTSNEAEYLTLIQGLRTTLVALDGAERDPKDSSIVVLSDSQLVVEQIMGRWKVRHEGLKPLHREARALLDEFGTWALQWHRRANSVRLLGH